MTSSFRRDAPPSWAAGVKSGRRVGVRPSGIVAGALLAAATVLALAVAGWGIKELSILWGAAAIAALAGVVVLTLRGFPLFAILTGVAGAVAWGAATRGRLPESWFDLLGVLAFIGINLAFVVPLVGAFLSALLLDARRVSRLSIDEAVSGRRWWGKPDDHLPRLKQLEAIPSARFFALGEGGCTHLVVAGRRVALFLPTVWPHGEFTMDAAGQVLRGGRLFVPGSEDVDGLAAEVHTWREQLAEVGGAVRGYLVVAPARGDVSEDLVITVAPGEHLHLVHAHEMAEAAGRWLSADAYHVDLHVMERLLFIAAGNKLPEPLSLPRTFAREASAPSTGRDALPTDAAFAAAAGEDAAPALPTLLGSAASPASTPTTVWRPGNGAMRARLGRRLARGTGARGDALDADTPSDTEPMSDTPNEHDDALTPTTRSRNDDASPARGRADDFTPARGPDDEFGTGDREDALGRVPGRDTSGHGTPGRDGHTDSGHDGRADVGSDADTSWEARSTRELVGDWDNDSASQLAAWAAEETSLSYGATPEPSSAEPTRPGRLRTEDDGGSGTWSSGASWSSTGGGDVPAPEDRLRWSSSADDFPVTYEAGTWPSSAADEVTSGARRAWTEPEETGSASERPATEPWTAAAPTSERPGSEPWTAAPASERPASEPWTAAPASARPAVEPWTAVPEPPATPSWRDSFASEPPSEAASVMAEPSTAQPWSAWGAPERAAEPQGEPSAPEGSGWVDDRPPFERSSAEAPLAEQPSAEPAPVEGLSVEWRSVQTPLAEPSPVQRPSVEWRAAQTPPAEPQSVPSSVEWPSVDWSATVTPPAEASSAEWPPVHWRAAESSPAGASAAERPSVEWRAAELPSFERGAADRPSVARPPIVSGEPPSWGGSLFDGDAPELVAKPLELRRSWDSDPASRSIRRRDRAAQQASEREVSGSRADAESGVSGPNDRGTGAGAGARATVDGAREQSGSTQAWTSVPEADDQPVSGGAWPSQPHPREEAGHTEAFPSTPDPRVEGGGAGTWSSAPKAWDEGGHTEAFPSAPNSRDEGGVGTWSSAPKAWEEVGRAGEWPSAPDLRVEGGGAGTWSSAPKAWEEGGHAGEWPSAPDRRDEGGRAEAWTGALDQRGQDARAEAWQGRGGGANGGQEEAWWDAAAKSAETAEKPKRSRWGRKKGAAKDAAPAGAAEPERGGGGGGGGAGWVTEPTSRWDRTAARNEDAADRAADADRAATDWAAAADRAAATDWAAAGDRAAAADWAATADRAAAADWAAAGDRAAAADRAAATDWAATADQDADRAAADRAAGDRGVGAGHVADGYQDGGYQENGRHGERGGDRNPDQGKWDAAAFDDLAPLELNLDEEPKARSRRFLRRK
ncbi:hypothetical protein [Dactylosporangium sp. NPDC051484]|uniref:hypothetical protein n=1 Tax=Dactylosporangium sp. NPDC051484 TaxID=3154942 RepID=UPI00344D52E9